MALAHLVKFQVRPLGQMPKLRRFAMHEFSSEFAGNRGGWISASEDTPADSIARFQHDDIAACDAEITRGSQTSGARADDQDIRTFVCRIGKVSGYHYILGTIFWALYFGHYIL